MGFTPIAWTSQAQSSIEIFELQVMQHFLKVFQVKHGKERSKDKRVASATQWEKSWDASRLRYSVRMRLNKERVYR